jgi:hypothetical protein
MNKASSIHPAIGYAARCLAEWLKHSLENIRGVTGNNGGEV